jgi:hypothetical protein
MLAFTAVNAIITTFALSQDGASKKTDKASEALKKENEQLEKQKQLLDQILILKNPASGKQYSVPFEKIPSAIADTESFLLQLDRIVKAQQLSFLQNEPLTLKNVTAIKKLKDELQTPLEYKGKTLMELPTDLKDTGKLIKDNREFLKKLQEDLVDYEDRKRIIRMIQTSRGTLASTDTMGGGSGSTTDTSYNFLSDLNDKYMKLTNSKYAYERWKAKEEMENALHDIEIKSKKELWKIDIIEKAKFVALKTEQEEMKRINAEEIQEQIDKANKIAEEEAKLLNMKKDAQETLAQYEIELGNKVLGHGLASIDKWYQAELDKNNDKFKKEAINQELLNQLNAEAYNVKMQREARLNLSEKRREKQERDSYISSLRQEYEVIDILSQNAANTLRDGFMEAWKSVFGEANSLFEKFISGIASDLANLATKQLAQGLFMGALDILGLGGGSLASMATGGNKPLSQTVVNLSLDGQVIDRRVITNFGNYQSVARNRRLL